MAPNICVSYKCASGSKAKLIQAQEFVCMYYNVPYKSYQVVCGTCLRECILNCKLMGNQLKNEDCLIAANGIPTYQHFIDLSGSDDEENIASTSYEHPQESQLKNALETTFQKMEIKDLINLQNDICQDYLDARRLPLIDERTQMANLTEEIENSIHCIHKNLYKYDNCRNFKFEEEVNIFDIDEIYISDIDENENIVNNDYEVHTKDQSDESSKHLPQEETLKRCLIKSGDKVYAQTWSELDPWFEATVQLSFNDTIFHISFGNNMEQVINYKKLAYTHQIKEQYLIGTRVIAKFKDVDFIMTNHFYAGIIAELPKSFNNNRYMIFFDNGFTQYAYHEDIRLVCHQSPEVSDDVHVNVKTFVKDYLDKYPQIPIVHFNKNQFVRTELDNKWYLAKVINLDASLVQLEFHDFENMRTEWIFRGSNRLGPIYNHINKNQEKRVRSTTIANINKKLNRPYIEFGYSKENQIGIDDNKSNDKNVSKKSGRDQKSNSLNNFNIIDFINIPLSSPKPFNYKDHQCNHFCMYWVNYNVNQTKNLNSLSIPLHFGFQRHTVKNENQESKIIKYTTPCGRSISNENEMYNYLKIVGYGESQMTIDLFNFDYNVNPLAVFKVTKYNQHVYDISNGKEFKPISAVNCFNNSILPPIRYITEREPKTGVKLNEDVKFLCCCDCTDNCDDKSKCSCWQLTLESVKNYPKLFKNHNIGYNYKRLYEPVYTGIYECNVNCKCLKTCSNRVVQEPLSTSLQLFLTEKKGWGVRTLADIPKGTFICTLVGELLTEKDAEKEGIEFGGDYLADLDYIETAEAIKKGYESDVENISEMESDISYSEDEEFDPGKYAKKKIKLSETSMSLRQKNIQNTKKKTNGKHRLSKLNTQQSVKTANKSFREYMDKDCGVYALNARTCGNVGRYFNHSCDPNVFFQNVFIDTHNLEFPWVAYFSLTNISAGTELCLDYEYEVGSVKGKVLKCHCGLKKCKGRFL